MKTIRRNPIQTNADKEAAVKFLRFMLGKAQYALHAEQEEMKPKTAARSMGQIQYWHKVCAAYRWAITVAEQTKVQRG